LKPFEVAKYGARLQHEGQKQYDIRYQLSGVRLKLSGGRITSSPEKNQMQALSKLLTGNG
jgi:hypothetical protein